MITFCDIAEFQENFDADAYLKGGYRVVIVRAHNGYRKDKAWPARRDYVRAKPFVAVGYYQYLVKGRDVVEQARDFTATIGRLRRTSSRSSTSKKAAAARPPGHDDMVSRSSTNGPDSWARSTRGNRSSRTSSAASPAGATAAYGSPPT